VSFLRSKVGAAAVVLSGLAASPAWASEGGSSTFLGLPVAIWKTANMLLFFGLLAYLLAKPLTAFFRNRNQEIARRLSDAENERAEAAQLRAEMEERTAKLSEEIASLQERLRQEGEREKAALEIQGEEEAKRLLEQVEREAGRRVDEAREGLAAEAAAVAAELSVELLQREMTAEDRRRIFDETLARLRTQQVGGGR
jgi:F-type H+-transporting ATPase subunit b